MTLYRFESTPDMLVNLDTGTDILKEHQIRLQKMSAAISKDLIVITDIIVERANDN